jgi:hypothetical protein
VNRLVRVALWGLVAAGAVGGIVAALQPTTVVQRAAVDNRADPVPLGVAGVAEVAVRQWLREEALGPAATRQSTLAVDLLTTVHVVELSPDHWRVTLAAEVRDGGGAPALWHFEIGVVRTQDVLRAAGTPAIVGHAAAAAIEAAGTPATSLPADDSRARTADAFLVALLTGAGDPVRYVAPGASVATIGSPPFVDLRVERVALIDSDSTTARVRVAATARSAAGTSLPLVYELQLAERDGRWEVLALNGVLAATDDTTPRPPATATTSTTQAARPGA